MWPVVGLIQGSEERERLWIHLIWECGPIRFRMIETFKEKLQAMEAPEKEK